jgi:hypothetical protein
MPEATIERRQVGIEGVFNLSERDEDRLKIQTGWFKFFIERKKDRKKRKIVQVRQTFSRRSFKNKLELVLPSLYKENILVF